MDLLNRIQSNITVIEEFLRANNIQRSKSVDLVLDLVETDHGFNTFYYFVDHSTRCVFFLNSFDAAGFPTWQEVKGVRSSTHVKHQIEANYWYHCLMFPRSLELSEDLIFEFRDLFIHSMSGSCLFCLFEFRTDHWTDQMVSETSVVSYNVDDLQKLVFLANSLQRQYMKLYKHLTTS
ncbi:hypothetical protein H2248_011992 [Termitomyces sp. 'cryptogamus']|nr:hypothetical protein H2248_011992 [Termitomyces sp. 'cryptogamus']